jgi:hypothetical protein
VAQQWLSYVDRAAGPVGILMRVGGWRRLQFLGARSSANPLSTLPQNSVSLAFLTTKFDHENFPETDERRENSTMPAVPSRDKLGRQPLEAFLLRTLQDD